jgi:hypothetical protein
LLAIRAETWHMSVADMAAEAAVRAAAVAAASAPPPDAAAKPPAKDAKKGGAAASEPAAPAAPVANFQPLPHSYFLETSPLLSNELKVRLETRRHDRFQTQSPSISS